MENLGRFIFEQSLCLSKVYSVLSKVSFKNDNKNLELKWTREVFSNIINSSNSEVVKRSKSESESFDEFGPRQRTLLDDYRWFYDGYLSNLNAYKSSGSNVNENRINFYLSLTPFLYRACLSLINSLNEYVSSESDEIVMMGQTALTLIKSLYLSNRVKNITRFLPKESGNSIYSLNYLTEFNYEFDNTLTDCEDFANLKVGRFTDVTSVNSICSGEQIKRLRGEIKSTFLTENQKQLVFDNGSSIDETLREELKAKYDTVCYTIPNEIDKLIDSVKKGVEGEDKELSYFLSLGEKRFDYPRYYTSNKVENKVEDVKQTKEIKQDKESVKPSNIKQSNWENFFKKFLHICSLPFIFIGEVFKKLWYGITHFGSIYYDFSHSTIGKILLFPFTIIIWIFKGVGYLFKGIWLTLAFLFRLITIKPIVTVIVGVVAVAVPVIILLANKVPCCYDYGKLIEQSTCSVQGYVEYVCQVHGEKKIEHLPYYHTISADGKCSTCSQNVSVTNDVYTSESEQGISVEVLAHPSGEVDEVVVAPYYDGEVVTEITFKKNAIIDGVEDLTESVVGTTAKTITIFAHPEKELIIDFENCRAEKVVVMGNVLVAKNADNIKNLFVNGVLKELIIDDFNSMDILVATSGVNKIATTKFKEGLFVDDSMEITDYLMRADVKNAYVSNESEKYKSLDGVVYSKDLTNIVYYPKLNKAKTYNIPEGVNDVSNIGSVLKYAENLRVLNFPDSVTTGYIAMGENSNIKEFNFSKNLKEFYFISFTDSLKKVSLANSGDEFTIFRENSGVYTEYYFRFIVGTPEENAEYLRDIGSARYVYYADEHE